MAQTFYNSAILRKIRSEAVSALEDAGYTLSNHFAFSSTNQLQPNFIITFLTKSLTDQSKAKMFTDVRNALEKKFQSKPTLTSIDGAGKQYRIDFAEVYTKREAEQKIGSEEKTDIGIPKSSEIENPVGDNEKEEIIETRKTFLKSISDLISSKFFYGKEIEGKITKHKGDKDVALVTVKKEYFYSIVDYLVSHEYIVLPLQNSSFAVFKEKISDGNDKNQYVRFTTDFQTAQALCNQLEELVRQIIFYLRDGAGGEPQFRCNTSISEIALRNMDLRMNFTIAEANLANSVAGILNELSIQSEKVGQLVYIDITKALTPELLRMRWDKFFQAQTSESKKKRGFVIEAGSDGRDQMVIHFSYDYSQFHFIPFNRDRVKSHTLDLLDSINEFGFLDVVLIARTDVIDGTMRDWIVDRQHRFDALVLSKRPIPYIFIYVHSKYELIRLIARLNSKSRKWQTKDYLNAWATLKMEEYTIITEWKDKGLPITIINQAMTGLDPRSIGEKFREGKIQFTNKERGKKVLTEFLLLKKCLPKGLRYASAAIKFLLKVQGVELFSIDKLLKNISVTKLSFTPNDRDQDIIMKLEARVA